MRRLGRTEGRAAVAAALLWALGGALPNLGGRLLVGPPAHAQQCDLTGTWTSIVDVVGEASWTFKPQGERRWSAQTLGFGGATGTAALIGSTLRVDFRSLDGSTTGSFEATMAADCSRAEGTWTTNVLPGGRATLVRAPGGAASAATPVPPGQVGTPGATRTGPAQYDGPAPVAHWSFDEGTGVSALDASGNGNTGAVNGAIWTDGVLGRALEFNGSDAYVNTVLDAQPGAMPSATWEAWVYPTRVNHGARQAILSVDDGGYDRTLTIEVGTASFAIFTGSGVWTAAPVDVNQWQHVVVVFTPDNVYFYKNGAQFSLGAAPTGGGTSARLRIGSNPGYGEFFQGKIDDVRIYNYARTPEQIARTYQSAAPAGAVIPAGPCDLAGVWTATLQGGGQSTWTFIAQGAGHYQAQESGLGNATGTALLQGSHVRIDFSAGAIAGSYDLQLLAGCQQAEGEWHNSTPAGGRATLTRVSGPPPATAHGGRPQPGGGPACGFTVGGGILARWQELGGEGGILGCPTMNEAAAAPSPLGTTGTYAEFAAGGDGGVIVWHGSGPLRDRAFEVHGAIFKLYKEMRATGGWLGFPVSDEYPVTGGRRNDFEGGYILWEESTLQARAYRAGDVAGGVPHLDGTWYREGDPGLPASIVQAGETLIFVNERGERSGGRLIDPQTVVATDWEGGLQGRLALGATRIDWANGTWWQRPGPPAPTLGREWRVCETFSEGDFSETVCGVWTNPGDGSPWTGVWRDSTATLAVVVSGQSITVTRADSSRGLQVVYRGAVNAEGTGMSGTVGWSDASGTRSGTWTAALTEP